MGLFGKTNTSKKLLSGGFSSSDVSQLEKIYNVPSQPIGEGNFAKVYLGTLKAKGEGRLYRRRETGNEKEDSLQQQLPIPEKVAIKIIDMSKVEDIEDIRREVTIMKAIHHQHVVNLFEVFDSAKKVVLIMEPAEGGELFDRIVDQGQYTERDAASTIAMLCDALEHLHMFNIVHRDIKPENILYKSSDASHPDYMCLKLADFGLARDYSQKTMMKTACGTPGYVAPEILKNEGYAGPACDMWSTGVLLYILLCGFPPFYDEDLPALFDSILKASFDFPSPWWDPVSPDAKRIIKDGLLVLDHEKRLTAKQVKEDVWIQNAADNNLIEAQRAMKKYNATRKLRKVAQGIIAQQRMTKALEALRGGMGSASIKDPVDVS